LKGGGSGKQAVDALQCSIRGTGPARSSSMGRWERETSLKKMSWKRENFARRYENLTGFLGKRGLARGEVNGTRKIHGKRRREGGGGGRENPSAYSDQQRQIRPILRYPE